MLNKRDILLFQIPETSVPGGTSHTGYPSSSIECLVHSLNVFFNVENQLLDMDGWPGKDDQIYVRMVKEVKR